MVLATVVAVTASMFLCCRFGMRMLKINKILSYSLSLFPFLAAPFLKMDGVRHRIDTYSHVSYFDLVVASSMSGLGRSHV